MFRKILIQNFKSLENTDFELGRINLFIGENGAGKSNLLEAIGFAAAAQAQKLDNEFLASRGLRASTPALMQSAFSKAGASKPIHINIASNSGSNLDLEISSDGGPYPEWQTKANVNVQGRDTPSLLLDLLEKFSDSGEDPENVKKVFEVLYEQIQDFDTKNGKKKGPRRIHLDDDLMGDFIKKYKFEGLEFNKLDDFVIFSPENTSLRQYQSESQIEPLGIRGEGLFKLLNVIAKSRKKNDKQNLSLISKNLEVFSWFDSFDEAQLRKEPRYIKLKDCYIDKSRSDFDHRNANEGFLFVLFYLTLFVSELTPKFFAVDNLDSSLNPKLCQKLLSVLVELAQKKDKQALLTTHNPAMLDGLDLTDKEQRLFAVSRDIEGRTQVRRIEVKPESAKRVRLSELFISGALGGLPKGF